MSSVSPEFQLGVTTEHTREIDLVASGEWLFTSMKSLHPEVPNKDLQEVIATIPEDTLIIFGQIYIGVVHAVHARMVSENR